MTSPPVTDRSGIGNRAPDLSPSASINTAQVVTMSSRNYIMAFAIGPTVVAANPAT